MSFAVMPAPSMSTANSPTTNLKSSLSEEKLRNSSSSSSQLLVAVATPENGEPIELEKKTSVPPAMLLVEQLLKKERLAASPQEKIKLPKVGIKMVRLVMVEPVWFWKTSNTQAGAEGSVHWPVFRAAGVLTIGFGVVSVIGVEPPPGLMM